MGNTPFVILLEFVAGCNVNKQKRHHYHTEYGKRYPFEVGSLHNENLSCNNCPTENMTYFRVFNVVR